MKNDVTHDVIILGGGIVGAACALALSNTTLRVALIEKYPPKKWDDDTLPLRVSAINRASENNLKKLGVWSQIEKLGVSPYRDVNVWDGEGKKSIQFDCREVNEPNLGHIIANRNIVHALWAALKETSVDIFSPAHPDQFCLDRDHQSARLVFEDEAVLSAKLIIGADGSNSWLRRQAQIDCHEWSYDQQAIVGVVRTERPHNKTARQCFLKTGPLALLPLEDPHLCSIVWSCDHDFSKRVGALDKDAFSELLAQHFDARLGTMTLMSERQAFPLQMRHAKEYVAPRLALVGDAVRRIHPLAGQGVNMGLKDVTSLIKLIKETVARNEDVGAAHTLRRYQRQRKADNWAVIGAMEGFKQLFGSNAAPQVMLRNTGLSLANRLPFVKNILMRRALGL